MIILGIETSCDETAAAVVENGQKILANVISSSESFHKRFGGIIPEKAAREQIKYIIPVINQALKEMAVTSKNQRGLIDAIAVTAGPGLIGSLLVGVETAKTLSFLFQKPLIPVNHLMGHIYANFLELTNLPQLPAICLVVSGGHTDLLLMNKNHTFKHLGGTRDDAAGECFDKCARMLGLGYPGGPVIQKAAFKFHSGKQAIINCKVKLPRPMMYEKNFDFSFSGLKTAVLTLVRSKKKFSHLSIQQFNNLLAFEIQEAISDVLTYKTLKAVEKFQVKSVLIGGGVAANQRLRKKLQAKCQKLPIKLFVPPAKLCTDNAAVTAATAFFQNQPVNWRYLKPNPSLYFLKSLSTNLKPKYSA